MIPIGLIIYFVTVVIALFLSVWLGRRYGAVIGFTAFFVLLQLSNIHDKLDIINARYQMVLEEAVKAAQQEEVGQQQ